MEPPFDLVVESVSHLNEKEDRPATTQDVATLCDCSTPAASRWLSMLVEQGRIRKVETTTPVDMGKGRTYEKACAGWEVD